MFQHLFSAVQKTDVVQATTASFSGGVLELAQSIASGFSQLFKANPYHDSSGRFARKDTPAAHHFVSLGGRRTRSNTRDRIADIVDQTALGTRLRALFDSNQAKRLAQTDAPTTPVRRTRTPSATQVARAAALAQRQALAERRAQLVAERTALVEQNHKYRPRDILHLTDNDRVRLQAQIDNPNTYHYTRINAQRRLDGATHGDALRLHGLTLNSTTATANRVPTHHLSPDSFGRSLHELNQAQALRRSQAAQATRRVLGDRLFNMTDEERRTTIGRLGRAAALEHDRAISDHVAQVVAPLVGLTHVERQQRLDAMSDGQRRAIDGHIGWTTRNDWRNAERLHAIAVVESERVAREGPHTGAQLHGMSDKERSTALAGMNETQRAGAAKAQTTHERTVAINLNAASHVNREATLAAMSPNQREAVTRQFTPSQVKTHNSQRAAHEKQLEVRRIAQEQQAATAARAAARAAASQAQRDAQDQQTVAKMTPEQRQAYTSVKELRAKGVSVTGGDRNLHADPDIAFALDFSNRYKGVDPQRLIDGYVGKGTPLKPGTGIQLGSNKSAEIMVPSGAMLHGSRLVNASSRSISVDRNGQLQAENNFLKLDSSSRGGGSGKKHFADMIPAYMDMGVKKLKVHGALENGFHTWAKYGFADDSPPAWRIQAMQKVQSAVSRMPNMSAEAKKELSKLDKAVRRFGNSKKFPNLAVRMKLPHLTQAYKDAGLSNRTSGNDFMGEALEWGNWYGTIDFSDKRQMDRVKKYVKGTDIKYFDKDGTQKPTSSR